MNTLNALFGEFVLVAVFFMASSAIILGGFAWFMVESYLKKRKIAMLNDEELIIQHEIAQAEKNGWLSDLYSESEANNRFECIALIQAEAERRGLELSI